MRTPFLKEAKAPESWREGSYKVDVSKLITLVTWVNSANPTGPTECLSPGKYLVDYFRSMWTG